MGNVQADGKRRPTQPLGNEKVYFANDFTAAASSSFTSKTVYSLVIWSRSCTFLVRLSSFSSPPWFLTVV